MASASRGQSRSAEACDRPKARFISGRSRKGKQEKNRRRPSKAAGTSGQAGHERGQFDGIDRFGHMNLETRHNGF